MNIYEMQNNRVNIVIINLSEFNVNIAKKTKQPSRFGQCRCIGHAEARQHSRFSQAMVRPDKCLLLFYLRTVTAVRSSHFLSFHPCIGKLFKL